MLSSYLLGYRLSWSPVSSFLFSSLEREERKNFDTIVGSTKNRKSPPLVNDDDSEEKFSFEAVKNWKDFSNFG